MQSKTLKNPKSAMKIHQDQSANWQGTSYIFSAVIDFHLVHQCFAVVGGEAVTLIVEDCLEGKRRDFFRAGFEHGQMNDVSFVDPDFDVVPILIAVVQDFDFVQRVANLSAADGGAAARGVGFVRESLGSVSGGNSAEVRRIMPDPKFGQELWRGHAHPLTSNKPHPMRTIEARKARRLVMVPSI